MNDLLTRQRASKLTFEIDFWRSTPPVSAENPPQEMQQMQQFNASAHGQRVI